MKHARSRGWSPNKITNSDEAVSLDRLTLLLFKRGISGMNSAPKSESTISWSADVPFNHQSVRAGVPPEPRVYKILQSEEYPRYEGRTRVLKIGMSESSLQAEILNHFHRHAAANRLARVRAQRPIISVIFAVAPKEMAKQIEASLLRQFEDSIGICHF